MSNKIFTEDSYEQALIELFQSLEGGSIVMCTA